MHLEFRCLCFPILSPKSSATEAKEMDLPFASSHVAIFFGYMGHFPWLCEITRVNGHFRNLNWRYLLYIRPI